MLTNESLMPFGKHMGKEMISVPCRYLLFIYDQYSKDEDIGLEMKEVLNFIKNDMEGIERGANIERNSR